MIRLAVTTARSLMNLLSIHLAVAVPLERVRLEAISAVNLCISPVGTGRVARVQRESCETNEPIMTLPAVCHRT
jgi:hypothetical protein